MIIEIKNGYNYVTKLTMKNNQFMIYLNHTVLRVMISFFVNAKL